MYDTTLLRPACTLLQAAYGATVSNADLAELGEWLVSPTPDMAMYELNEEQMKKLKVMARMGEKRGT